MLTINGLNFGRSVFCSHFISHFVFLNVLFSSGASVYIGSQPCLGTTHTPGQEDSQLTCTLPKVADCMSDCCSLIAFVQGTGLSLPVVVLQANGGLSSGMAVVSNCQVSSICIVSCVAGDAVVSYHQCPPGSYQVLLDCFSCPPGNLICCVCVYACACVAGNYSDAPGQPSCNPCPVGTFSASKGAILVCCVLFADVLIVAVIAVSELSARPLPGPPRSD